MHSKHDQPNNFTGEKVRLTRFDSNTHEYLLVNVQLQEEPHCDTYEVAVSSTLDVDTLLGLDLELLAYLFYLKKAGIILL